MKWKISPKALLIFTCCYYFAFAASLIHPANLIVREHGKSTYGKQDRHILRVWRMAKYNASKPFEQVKDHALFHKRNPGLFKFIAELTIRAGAKSPIPLQFFLIFLVILGIIAQSIWLKEYFKSDVFPVVGNLFILGTHFLTFFGSTIHQHPYNFAFFNFCMFFIVRFVQKKSWKFFVMAWCSYFFLCQNYYMFWVSTFIMMAGVLYFSKNKLINKEIIILSLAPILTVVLLLIQVSNYHGGLNKGVDKVKEAAEARMLDNIRSDAPAFKKKMSAKDWLGYPMTISSRVERYFYIPGIVFLIIFLLLVFRIKPQNSLLNYKFFYFLVPAGLSWYLLMFQHTSVHVVAGRYSYFLWMIMLGYLFYELKQKIEKYDFKRWFKYCWVFVLVYGIYGFSYVNTKTLFMNFVRLYQYSTLYENAENGSIEARLELFSNKFANAYHMLDEGWLKNLTNKNIKLDDNIILKYEQRVNSNLYLVLESPIYRRGNEKKLFINDKFYDLTYPNEYERYFQEDRFTVLKFKDLKKIQSISMREI